ncbi:hypothetical protein B0H14DRAFT_3126175 [Mycena olivaceomarginata]|nr:hypothetical protein B0H14DRAFT_3128344 [Mycena olivaceomarginata]KAJ7892054.1 hypothetical protein B0H14DRAFT_3126175 [Mycena olivaceomarginata]
MKSKIEGKNATEGETQTREPRQPPRNLAVTYWFLKVTFVTWFATSPILERRKCPHRPKHAQGGPDALVSSTRKVGKRFHPDIVRRCPECFRIQILVIHRRKKSRSRRSQSKDESPVVLSRDMRIRIGAALRGGRDLSRFETHKNGTTWVSESVVP